MATAPNANLARLGTATTSREPPSSTPPALAPQARLAEWQRAPGGRERFAEPIAVTAAREDEERREVAALDEPDEGDDRPPYERIRADAEVAAPPGTHPHMATLLWIDARCVAAGMHALDVWWLGTLAAFYATGKLVLVVRCGLRGAKSVSICRALVNDALFGRCAIDPGTPAVIPVMSADRTEATDRFHTIRAVLAACGVANEKEGDDEGIVLPDGLAMTYKARTLPSGGGVIEVTDSDGRAVEFRIYPARLSGVIGYTAKHGFGDELDTWPVDLGVSATDVAQRSAGGRANPADVVLDRWLERFTTTRKTAHLYLVSASYFGRDTAHARWVAAGDTDIAMVARLGADGAQKDTAARRVLAVTIGSTDPRLLAPADAMSTDVPAWVTSPAAPIETCYALSRSRLGPMLGRYGGRPDESEGAGMLAGVAFPVDERTARPLDAVTGLAPDPRGAWGRVMVWMVGDAFLVASDDTGRGEPFALPMGAPSVYAVAAPQEPALRAEVAAYVAAHPGAYLPPVAAQAIHDGGTLRLSPLRLLYLAGRLRHAPGLGALESALRSAHDDGERSPRVEALVAAVARLVGIYPWLGVKADEAPMRAPRAAETMHDGGTTRASEMLRRLGAVGET